MGAGALVVALAGTALAEDGNQTNVAWNAGASLCTGGPDNGQGGHDIVVPDGQVAWVFVHTGQDQSASGTLTANFENAGDGITAQSYWQGGLKYLIITDIPDTLKSFSDDLSGGQLTLSHTCYGSESSTTSFTSSEESSSTSSSSSTTSFVSSEESTSTSETLPNTATFGTSGSNASSNGLWMLIAGLGVVGGSVLVLMPSRAKGKR
jgi:hypothetical protein